jgi:subtilisin family serine protease
MRSSSRRYWGFVALLVATAVAVASWGITTGLHSADAAAGPSAERAKAVVSQATGIRADEFTVVNVAPFGDTGIRQLKMMDRRGRLFGASLDAAGNPVSDEEMKHHARALGNRGFVGKLERELAERMRGNPSDPIRTVWWMQGTTMQPLRGPNVTPQQFEQNLQAVATEVSAVVEPVMNGIKAMGGQVIGQSSHVPMAVANVTPAVVRRMAAHPLVERVFLERVHSERLNVSRVVVQADQLNSIFCFLFFCFPVGRGIDGTGQRVAVVEANRIGTHPDLPGSQRVLCRATASSTAGGHKTNVAGVIQSINLSSRGMAPAITIVDGIAANFSDAEVMAATDCVIDTEGASAVNMSFGFETNGVFDAFARYVDRKVYFTGRTIVPAISNFCANRMGSPEIAFNALAVGAFDDSNTTGFGDDVAACTGVVTFSAFLDPISPSGDREEPDVVTPGRQINTTVNGGGFADVNGTSFAAPHVTGGVGLLVQRDPSLAFQVERVRAVMMSAARHNIEGASRLSERDGAGAIFLAAADTVLTSGNSSFFVTSGGTTGFPITRSFSASAGQRVRVAIAWSHKSPGGDTLTQPTTDLDLVVRDPNGFFVAGSFSFDNTYEIVDFTAPVTGTYTATINNFRSSSGTEFIGFAVSLTDS